jgi:hypothetical protein
MKSIQKSHLSYLLAWLLALVCYATAINSIDHLPHSKQQDEINIAIPAIVQIVMAGGDRYLAANIAVFRALVVGVGKLDNKSYEILAKVQTDAARMNPAHEDNYYISQAILPWAGEVKADLFIQEAATKSRTWDFFPAFFLGFDRYYFLRDPIEGAKSVEIAAQRTPENHQSLTHMAARWSEKGDDPREAIKLVTAMMEGTRDKELKKNLQSRITRLTGLATLRDAAKQFQQNNSRPIASLDELIKQGLISELPQDPLGDGYAIDKNGLPVISKAVPKPAPKQP